VNQCPDINSLNDFILDRERKSAGIPYISRKTWINIIQDHDSEPHPVTTVVFAGFDVIDPHISVSIHGRPPLLMYQ
jgi:hypothetical protein